MVALRAYKCIHGKMKSIILDGNTTASTLLLWLVVLPIMHIPWWIMNSFHVLVAFSMRNRLLPAVRGHVCMMGMDMRLFIRWTWVAVMWHGTRRTMRCMRRYVGWRRASWVICWLRVILIAVESRGRST